MGGPVSLSMMHGWKRLPSGLYQPRAYTAPLTSAQAAWFSHLYSVFLLNPDYSGPLVRLYRVSDGTERDFYADAVTGQVYLPGVAAWAGASGALVCRLYNQIGDGTYLEQTSVTNMPVFDPADGTCDCDEADGVVRYLVRTGLSIAQPYTVFWQGIRTGGSGVAQIALNLVGASTPGGIGLDGSSDNKVQIKLGSAAALVLHPSALRAARWQTAAFICNGATSYAYQNWVEHNWASASSVDAAAVDTISAGGVSGNNTLRWQGRFSAILIAPSALTRENQRLVAQKLNLMMGTPFAGMVGGASSFGWSVARSVLGVAGAPLAVLEEPVSPFRQVVLRSDWRGFACDAVGEHCDGWGVRTLYNQNSLLGTGDATQTDRAKQPRFNWGGGANGTLTGFNSMTFDGADDHLVTASFAMAAQDPLCVMALLKAHGTPPSADQWLCSQGAALTGGWGFLLRANSAANGWQTGDACMFGRGYQSGQTAKWIYSNVQGLMDGTWRSTGGRRGSSDAQQWVYSSGTSTAMSERSESNVAMDAVTGALYIGALSGSSGFFKGDLVEVKVGQDANTNTYWAYITAQLGGLGGRVFS